jgi:type II secretory pathway pseudopilin PulG
MKLIYFDSKDIRCAGISVLELLVTLLIVSLIITAVLQVLQSTSRQMDRMNREMTQRGLIQASLDKLMEDISQADRNNSRVAVKEKFVGGYDSSQVTIEWSDWEGEKAYKTIDWVAVPEYDGEGLVLYRRATSKGSEEEEYFIPLCENLYSFQVKLLSTEEGAIDDPNNTQMIDVLVESYRDEQRDPDRLLVVSRTFCRDRMK